MMAELVKRDWSGKSGAEAITDGGRSIRLLLPAVSEHGSVPEEKSSSLRRKETTFLEAKS
jgi:hypothetical protein